MKSWFKRMKPKFKNWRWWVALPVILISAVVLGVIITLPAAIFELLSNVFKNLSDWWCGLQDAKVLKYVSKIIKWSGENE